MANKSCQSCADLQNDAPGLIVNGMTTTERTSLANNTGLSPGNANNDCTDLNNMNDCLIGNLESEVDAYDVCDWKEYTKNFVDNTWTVFAGVIAAICGLWTKTANILSRLSKLECIVNNLTKTQSWQVGEEYIKYAPGISKTAGLVEPRITGNAFCGYLTGSITISETWQNNHPRSSLNDGGAMLYEYRIPKSLMDRYKIKYIWAGQAQNNGAGNGIMCHMYVFRGGDNLWGYDDNNASHYRGVVPNGACYIQVRMASYQGDDRSAGVGSTGNTTIAGVMPVLLDTAEFEC